MNTLLAQESPCSLSVADVDLDVAEAFYQQPFVAGYLIGQDAPTYVNCISLYSLLHNHTSNYNVHCVNGTRNHETAVGRYICTDIRTYVPAYTCLYIRMYVCICLQCILL